MSSTCTDRDRTASAITPTFWHVAFAVLLVVSLILLTSGDDPLTRKFLGIGLTVALGAHYTTSGRPIIAADGHDSAAGFVRYIVPAFALVATMLFVSPVFFVLLWMLYPQIFASAPTLRWGAAGSVVLSVIWVVAAARWVSPSYTSHGWQSGVVQGAVGLVFSIAMGWWVTRIVEESHRRAELIDELNRTRAELAVANHEAGALTERQRFTGEIHDTLAQGFTSVVMLLQAADGEMERDPVAARRHIQAAQRTARENLAEARALVADALPVALQTATLPDAVTRLSERLAEDLDIDVETHIEGLPRVLPSTHEVALLRAAQEALANVRKHAHAGRVDAVLRYADDATTLTITDDGRGFDVGHVTGGFGLAGLRTRLQQVGGNVAIRSTPGAGTTVTVQLP